MRFRLLIWRLHLRSVPRPRPIKGESKMPLFEVAILELPKPKEAKDGKLERFVMKEDVIAVDQQSAGMKLILNEKQKLAGVDPDRIAVLVRPFA